MAQVAERAQVSRATVSRVLAGTAQVAEATRLRVLEAIEALGYVPSAGAQQLAAGKSRTVGLLIRSPANPAYGELFSKIQEWTDAYGLELVTVAPTYYRGAADELSALRRLVSMRVGAILVSTGVIRTEELKQFLPVLPIVTVGRPESDPEVYGVSYDEVNHATQVARAVYGCGHRKVAVVSPPTENSLAEHLRGVRTAEVLRDLGCEVFAVDARAFGTSKDGAGAVIDLVQDRSVTAAVFSNDLRSVDFLTQARKIGIEAPRDLSVVGLDGLLPGLELMGLASLTLPVGVVARRAVEVISQMLNDRESVQVRHELYSGELHPGASLGAVPGM